MFPPFRSATRAAHPRSRGENVQVTGAGDRRAGSSPLTRGKLRLVVGRRVVAGLIPAHAGKTTARRRTTASVPAHPRSRGENEMLVSMSLSFRGSSPLTRGKLGHGLVESRGRRLIPAHAGKTPAAKRAGAASRAHPRSRGENADRQRETATAWGSSPLTRGKPDLSEVGGPLTRLIPAHAGKTAWGGLR